jgi:hypothetical protein
VVAALYGIICLPWPNIGLHLANGWHMLFASPRVYPRLALPFVLYAIIYHDPSVRARMTKYRRETWAFGAALVLLAAMGTVSAYRHGRDQTANYPSRILTLPDSLLMGEPTISAMGLYFTRMPGLTPGFAAWHWAGTQLTSLPRAEDEFHPTSNPTLSNVWIEMAGPISNIVRVSTARNINNPTVQLEVANGEQPSVSPDGRWLAFIRETHCRGELWLKELAKDSAAGFGRERKIVDKTYDVWEAAFEPGDCRIVFTTAPHGEPHLFRLDIDSQRIDLLPIAGPARYPAFSSDGQELAYSRLERGTWPLWATDLNSGRNRRLENGDCNTIAPVWERDSNGVIYATDCGRGLEMTALARVEVSP